MWWQLSWLVATAAAVLATSCNEARLRCAYRLGCGAALNNYLLMCSNILESPASTCPQACQHALIALTSTDEGKELMTCDCDDDYCRSSKRNIDVCRPEVIRGAANATASCRLSQLICVADAQCATALDFYHRLCRGVFRGRNCSNKCLNSIQILRKQEKAAALTACHCDGFEEYDCPRMQKNLNRLCFHKHKKGHGRGHEGHNKKTHKEVVEEKPTVSGQVANVPPTLLSFAVSLWILLVPHRF